LDSKYKVDVLERRLEEKEEKEEKRRKISKACLNS
jgi:hypothetical protein